MLLFCIDMKMRLPPLRWVAQRFCKDVIAWDSWLVFVTVTILIGRYPNMSAG